MTRHRNTLHYTYLFLFLILLFTNIAKAQENPAKDATPVSPNQQAMAEEKMKYEIEKLRQEIRTINLSPWLQTGTLIAALIAAVVSFWSAWRSQSNQLVALQTQIQHQQKDRMSDLLKELGSNQAAVKIAAIQALSEYESAFPFLVNMLSVDTERRVCSAVVTSLQSKPLISLPLLVDASKTLYNHQIYLAGELISLGLPKKEVVSALSIDNEILTIWIDQGRCRRIQETINAKLAVLRDQSPTDTDQFSTAEKKRVLDDWAEIRTSLEVLLNAVERVIESAIKLSIPFSLKGAYLPGIILDELDLSDWDFEDADLRCASFRKSVCRGTNFSGSLASGADFREAALDDSRFDHSSIKTANFSKAFLLRTSFQYCKGYKAKFAKGKLDSTDFAHSNLAEASFERCTGRKVSFKQSVLYHVDLTASEFIETDFSGTNLTGTIFHLAETKKSSFAGAGFIATKLTRAHFHEADFSGCKFVAIDEYSGSTFSGTAWQNAIYNKQTDKFLDYLNKRYG